LPILSTPQPIYDAPLQFSAYMLDLAIAEKLAPMSRLLQLAVQQQPSSVSYQLLNHNNKATFDFARSCTRHRKTSPALRSRPTPLYAETWLRLKLANGSRYEPQMRDIDGGS
jgi:hypothetical protein